MNLPLLIIAILLAMIFGLILLHEQTHISDCKTCGGIPSLHLGKLYDGTIFYVECRNLSYSNVDCWIEKVKQRDDWK